jgi:CRISPR-associated exonuclease Cas4
MLDTAIPEGAIFYGKTHRRERVPIDESLRHKTTELSEQMHTLWDERTTPVVDEGPKCARCSLKQHCISDHGSASAYLNRMLQS